jgi:MSHA biogenesis protein MshL
MIEHVPTFMFINFPEKFMKKLFSIIVFTSLLCPMAYAEIKEIVYDGKEIYVHVKKGHMTAVIFPQPVLRVTRGFAADSYVVQRDDKQQNVLELMPTISEGAEMGVRDASGESYVLKFLADDNFYSKLIIRKVAFTAGKTEGRIISSKIDDLPGISLEKQGAQASKAKSSSLNASGTQAGDLPSQLNQKITLKGNDLPLKIYFSTISQATGFNIITTSDVDSQKVSVNLENIEVWRALKSLLFRFGYGFKISREDLIISASETRIFTVKSLPADQSFTDSTSNESFSDNTNTYNASNPGQQQSQEIRVGSKIYYQNSASKLSMWAELENNINSILTPKIGTCSINKTNGMIIVTDQPGVLDKVGEIVDSINENLSRQETFQIEICEVNLSDSNETGVDWNLLVKNLKGLASLTSATNFASAGFLGGQLFSLAAAVPDPQSGTSQGGVSMIVKALEQQGTVRVVSKPSITVTNMFPAILQAVSSIPYISGTGSTIGTNLSQTNVITSQVSDGLTMRIEAKIEDHKTVLNISVVENSLDAMNSVPVGGGLTIQEPQVSTKSVTTNVEIDDSKTLILGGLISDKKKDSVKGIPYFSRIPFLGNFFQFKATAHERDELVIFITPNIPVKPAENL